ncbi:RxLR effector protein [Phytophthora megakarya]|uniref:RxLR effector protein n=1 Tax=Phytophthora megakarya TaxID=4795 RepID=A0A225VMN9_9STRA|nr:RxLR effector protein [Phytophthora megakarya]
MTAKFSPMRNFQVAILFAVVAFQPCISAISIDFPVIISPSLHLASRLDQNGLQNKRNLRAHVLATTDDNSDERGLNFGSSTVTKFKDLTTTAAQKIEKLAASTKLKISSKHQATVDKRFKAFKADKVDPFLLFESGEFGKWYTFVMQAFMKVEEGEVAMVRTLTDRYGDDVLAKLLAESQTVPSTKVIAGKLEEAQFTKWLVDEKSMSDVFKLLKLDKAETNFFKSPLFSSWVKYANKFDENPEEILFSTLKSHFGEEKVSKMLISARSDTNIPLKLEELGLGRLKHIVDKLQEEAWRAEGKTVDDIFTMLKVGSYGDNFDKSDEFAAISYLEKQYGDLALARILGMEKNQEKTTTKEIVSELQQLQFKQWKANGMDPKTLNGLLTKTNDAISNLVVKSAFKKFYDKPNT